MDVFHPWDQLLLLFFLYNNQETGTCALLKPMLPARIASGQRVGV